MKSAIAILMYHSLDASGSVVSVPPRVFGEQMATLASAGVECVSLREAIEKRESGGEWPARCAVVTFDDGYASVHEHALPVLREHGFGATVFVVSGHVGGRNDWAPPPRRLGERPLLSWGQIEELAASGVEIGAHTVTHPDLTSLADDEIKGEIVRSKDMLEAGLGRSVETFAYPYGRENRRASAVARQTFRAACTTSLRRAGGEDHWSLPRVDMYYALRFVDPRRVVEGGDDWRLAVLSWGRAIGGLVR